MHIDPRNRDFERESTSVYMYFYRRNQEASKIQGILNSDG